MLSTQSIETIKSTIPVLEVHGEEITKHFYEMLFSNHPELLNIFNHANQKQGRQQKALANTVYAAAKYIDNLEAIIPVVKQIAHKHRSLGIKAEHYPIVGKHLLLAIKDILGDAATDEILSAWEEAYGVIADAFISIEAEMYDEAKTQHGGWDGFREFTIAKKVEESNVITSFYLTPSDGKSIADFLPGQYISLQFTIPGEENTHIRQYSLSDSPGKDYYRITVKQEESGNETIPDGKVSTYLHEGVQEGDIIMVSAPAGDFILDMDHSKPVVLISGGVGITPMLSMLNTIVEKQPNRQTIFIHAAINSKFHAMREYIHGLAKENQNIHSHVCYQSPTDDDRKLDLFDKEGYVDIDWLKSILKVEQEADYYFCGPVPFMKAIYSILTQLNIAEENIHYEFFGPQGSLVD
ncbi:NO-inducible flavohemoprotein [Cytobacillus sp. S13-E01]|uniref:NO-inducible flavohemoprotein n=1 Tax=Cytobacillus sp. S13-E01 TaxID=3031326 RepID=UPI0023D82CD9|nr:NO-inducible flavohemoprotein [Cytobacillus sp. S13-E01]MDF0726848.1 NO-inducible flavohemoprotein [Cytobacillus sp. S13-E01]